MTHSDEVTLNTYDSARRSRVLLLKYGTTFFVSLLVEMHIKDKCEDISTGEKERLFSTRGTREIELTKATQSSDQISWTQNSKVQKRFFGLIFDLGEIKQTKWESNSLIVSKQDFRAALTPYLS